MKGSLKGVIFDLDGTLVDSRLDFEAMRAEIGITSKKPVLEFVEALPNGDYRNWCQEVLYRHELAGSAAATLMPGVIELLRHLHGRGLKTAILTRNRTVPTQRVLSRLGLAAYFDPVITRDDAPAKPDPAGVNRICAKWGCHPTETIMVGDYIVDILTGQRAGMRTVFYGKKGSIPSYAREADHITTCFYELILEFTAPAGAF